MNDLYLCLQCVAIRISTYIGLIQYIKLTVHVPVNTVLSYHTPSLDQEIHTKTQGKKGKKTALQRLACDDHVSPKCSFFIAERNSLMFCDNAFLRQSRGFKIVLLT